MPDDSPAEPTCYVARAFTSPLLADPEWVAGFRWFAKQLLSIAHDLKRYDSMPSYRDTLLKTKWNPHWDGLALHLKKVVDAGRNGSANTAYAMDGHVCDAFQLACAAMDENRERSTPNKTPIPLTALEGMNELLSRSNPAATPEGGKLPAIIAAAQALDMVLRNYVELSATPGYDRTIGLGRISQAAIDVSQLLATRNVEGVSDDSHAADYCNVLIVCVDRLIDSIRGGKDPDADTVVGVRKAIAALEPLQTRRKWNIPPRKQEPAIDYDSLANKLAAQSKPMQAALVRFMKDKDAAENQDIADEVHKDSQTSDKAMAKNARETTASLVELDSRLSFRVAGGMMHKEISPE